MLPTLSVLRPRPGIPGKPIEVFFPLRPLNRVHNLSEQV